MSRFFQKIARKKRAYQKRRLHKVGPVFKTLSRQKRHIGLSGMGETTMAKQSEIQLAQWLQRNDPFLFEIAVQRAEKQKQQMHGLFDSIASINWADIAKSAVSTVKDIAPALVQYKTQSKILKTQLKRAESGLPPLETSQYAPTIGVSAEITPEMEAAAARVANSAVTTGIGQMGQFLPYIAIGGLALILLMRKRR